MKKIIFAALLVLTFNVQANSITTNANFETQSNPVGPGVCWPSADCGVWGWQAFQNGSKLTWNNRSTTTLSGHFAWLKNTVLTTGGYSAFRYKSKIFVPKTDLTLRYNGACIMTGSYIRADFYTSAMKLISYRTVSTYAVASYLNLSILNSTSFVAPVGTSYLQLTIYMPKTGACVIDNINLF